MNKIIKYQADARAEMLSGVQLIAKAVKGTLGPSGRNVFIKKSDGEKIVTKDGVTVAGNISSDKPLEQMAIELIQDVANMSDESAGDGTTTATILAEALLTLGNEMSDENTNLIDMKRGIDTTVKRVVDELKRRATSAEFDSELLHKVALISSNNDKDIADIVLKAFKTSGDKGIVNIKRSRTYDTFLTTIEGANISTGYLSPYFVTNHEDNTAELVEPYVYMTNYRIDTVSDNLNRLLQEISEDGKTLLIICKEMSPQVLNILVDGYSRGQIKVCVCKAPGFGEQQNRFLRDLGFILGKEPYMELDTTSSNFDEVDFSEVDKIYNELPQSEAIKVADNNVAIKGPIGTEEQLAEIETKKKGRVASLKKELELTHKTSYERSELQGRISQLSQGIVFINIGAVSDIEYTEKQHRIQDALYAVKSAHEEGVVPGGGTALLYIGRNLEQRKAINKSLQIGCDIVFKALEAPFFQIMKNVGYIDDERSNGSFNYIWNEGFDARTLTFEKDMIDKGIVDPVKVTRVALENAASIVGMLLTTDCVVVDTDAYKKHNQQNLF